MVLISAHQVPEPDPLPGICFDTRPDPIQNVSGHACSEKKKPDLGVLAIFHKPSHTKGLWKIALPPKYGFSLSKQVCRENNIFLRFGFFAFVFPEKFSIDFLRLNFFVTFLHVY